MTPIGDRASDCRSQKPRVRRVCVWAQFIVIKSRVARLRSVEDWAMSVGVSVPHRAAEYPAQAAVKVTSASRIASPICSIRE